MTEPTAEVGNLEWKYLGSMSNNNLLKVLAPESKSSTSLNTADHTGMVAKVETGRRRLITPLKDNHQDFDAIEHRQPQPAEENEPQSDEKLSEPNSSPKTNDVGQLLGNGQESKGEETNHDQTSVSDELSGQESPNTDPLAQRSSNVYDKKKENPSKKPKLTATGNEKTGRWTEEEHQLFVQALTQYGKGKWKRIANMIQTRTVVQVRTHAQKYFEKLAKKGDLAAAGDSDNASAAKSSSSQTTTTTRTLPSSFRRGGAPLANLAPSMNQHNHAVFLASVPAPHQQQNPPLDQATAQQQHSFNQRVSPTRVEVKAPDQNEHVPSVGAFIRVSPNTTHLQKNGAKNTKVPTNAPLAQEMMLKKKRLPPTDLLSLAHNPFGIEPLLSLGNSHGMLSLARPFVPRVVLYEAPDEHEQLSLSDGIPGTTDAILLPASTSTGNYSNEEEDHPSTEDALPVEMDGCFRRTKKRAFHDTASKEGEEDKAPLSYLRATGISPTDLSTESDAGRPSKKQALSAVDEIAISNSAQEEETAELRPALSTRSKGLSTPFVRSNRTSGSVEMGSWKDSKTFRGLRTEARSFKMIKLIKAFRKKHGHVRVPQKQKPLGVWVNKIRQVKKESEEKGYFVSDMLNAEIVSKLDKLGFEWSLVRSWEDNYELLRKFWMKEGHCDYPTKSGDDSPLGRWVSSQRRDYKWFVSKDPAVRSKALITEEGILKLEALGFNWSFAPNHCIHPKSDAKRNATSQVRKPNTDCNNETYQDVAVAYANDEIDDKNDSCLLLRNRNSNSHEHEQTTAAVRFAFQAVRRHTNVPVPTSRASILALCRGKKQPSD